MGFEDPQNPNQSGILGCFVKWIFKGMYVAGRGDGLGYKEDMHCGCGC